VLDVALMPELARSLKAEQWSARIWVRSGNQLAQVEVKRPGWNVKVAVDKIEFAPALPASTWEPSVAQSADLIRINAVRYQQILDAIQK
jgi:hypothetical protein